MPQSHSDPAPAVDPDAGERRPGDAALPTAALSSAPLRAEESPNRSRVNGPSGAAARARIDNLTDELASRIESLRVFVSEQTEAAGDATRSESPIDAGRVSGSPEGLQGSATAGAFDARATMEAIRKLSEHLVTLPALHDLHSGLDQRLVRAEETLHRIEDFMADRTLTQVCARVDEGLVRTEEMLRRIDAIVTDRTSQQLSARIEARLANAEDAVKRIERLVEGGSLREIAAQSHQKLARIEADLRRLERIIQRDSQERRITAADAAHAGVVTPRPRWSSWIAALNRVDGLQLARRAAAVLVLLAVIVIAGLRHEPNELSELQVIPSNALRVRPLPIFLAPALISSPVGESSFEEPVVPLPPAAAPVRVPSRNPATLQADAARSDTPYVGTLRVASTPTGASVFVNGRPGWYDAADAVGTARGFARASDYSRRIPEMERRCAGIRGPVHANQRDASAGESVEGLSLPRQRHYHGDDGQQQRQDAGHHDECRRQRGPGSTARCRKILSHDR